MSFVMVSGDEELVDIGAIEAVPSLERVIMLRMADRWVPTHSLRWRMRQARVEWRLEMLWWDIVLLTRSRGCCVDEKDFSASSTRLNAKARLRLLSSTLERGLHLGQETVIVLKTSWKVESGY